MRVLLADSMYKEACSRASTATPVSPPAPQRGAVKRLPLPGQSARRPRWRSVATRAWYM